MQPQRGSLCRDEVGALSRLDAAGFWHRSGISMGFDWSTDSKDTLEVTLGS